MRTFACPYCQGQLQAAATSAPAATSCPHCGGSFHVTDPHAPPPPPPPGPKVVVPLNVVQGGGFDCPFCHCNLPPKVEKRVSTAGWITTIALLFFCFIFFWIGLCMQEEYHVCRGCGIKLS